MELLLTRQVAAEPQTWQALVHPGRKIGVGEVITIAKGEAQLEAEVIARGTFGSAPCALRRRKIFSSGWTCSDMFPCRPISIVRIVPRTASTTRRSMPRAGFGRRAYRAAALHAGNSWRARERGVESAEITLHVGLGTFQPVRTEMVEQHRLHTEHYEISPSTAGQIEHARREGRRIVAVGTTTVRTLEYAASRRADGHLEPQRGEADIFIYPGFDFRVVSAMLTNFHLPKSTLLMLVSAFAGRDLILRAYRHAVEQRYRFFSYGDCMLIE